ncbi:alpha-amylase, partial [candidate division KSB1 bacterium]
VFEKNYQNSYLPFLEIISEFPDIPFSLHYSGSLLEWIEKNHPEFFDILKKVIKNGNIEIFGGAFYEPILSMLPDRDSIGQIKLMQKYIKKTFNQKPLGFWLTERVWEQTIVKILADCGVKYTIVDDYHLKNAGIFGEKLYGSYVTEDQGRTISVFPSDEDLRYMIPFAPPDVVVQYLIDRGTDDGTRLLVYGDDGEKFGGWPGTKEHVYKNKWLFNFLTLLRKNKDSINILTIKDAFNTIKPLAKIYIPTSSYREMMEWSLPYETGVIYERAYHRLKNQVNWDENKLFFKGGYWRNFKYKYPEANRLYAKMVEVSNKINILKKNNPDYKQALISLYKGQCNCPYWHGVFGGLYLNHLRFATYKNLIEAEKIISSGNNQNNIIVEEKDFDADGYNEISVENGLIKIYIKPDQGGNIYEIDLIEKGFNVIDTMSRRPEVYHSDLYKEVIPKNQVEAISIHNLSKVKDKELYKYLVYDWYDRNYLIDHFFPDNINVHNLEMNNYRDLGDFTLGKYNPEIQNKKKSVEIILSRTGYLYFNGVKNKINIKKTIILEKYSSTIKIIYELKNYSDEKIETIFGVEFNYSMLAGNSGDRYYYFQEKENKGGILGNPFTKRNLNSVGIIDEWQNLDINLQFKKPALVYGVPVKTISQSETQYEKVYQSSAIIPCWKISLDKNEKWNLEIIQSFKNNQK